MKNNITFNQIRENFLDGKYKGEKPPCDKLKNDTINAIRNEYNYSIELANEIYSISCIESDEDRVEDFIDFITCFIERLEKLYPLIKDSKNR